MWSYWRIPNPLWWTLMTNPIHERMSTIVSRREIGCSWCSRLYCPSIARFSLPYERQNFRIMNKDEVMRDNSLKTKILHCLFWWIVLSIQRIVYMGLDQWHWTTLAMRRITLDPYIGLSEKVKIQKEKIQKENKEKETAQTSNPPLSAGCTWIGSLEAYVLFCE